MSRYSDIQERGRVASAEKVLEHYKTCVRPLGGEVGLDNRPDVAAVLTMLLEDLTAFARDRDVPVEGSLSFRESYSCWSD